MLICARALLVTRFARFYMVAGLCRGAPSAPLHVM